MRKPTFWFSTWSDTNQAVYLQKIAMGLEISDLESRGISVTARLILVFVFAYSKRWISHDMAHICIIQD